MANEITITASLSVRKGHLDYRSRPTTFRSDMAAANPKGEVPGAITVGVTHTVVDLSELGTPGVCWMQNLDDENFVQVGLVRGLSGDFEPLLELLPGEGYPLRLSRFLGQSLDAGTGTGTADTTTVYLALKAVAAPCVVRVHCFER